MSARYRRVSPLMWDDAWFVMQTDAMRNLWQLLLSGPQVLPVPGLQLTGPGNLAETLRRPFENVSTMFQELVAEGRVEYDPTFRLVRVVQAPKHNPPDNPNQISMWWNAWRALPDSPIKFDHVSSLKEVVDAIDSAKKKPFTDRWKETFGTLPERLPNVQETLTEGCPNRDRIARASGVGSREQGVGSRDQKYDVELGTRPDAPKPEQPSLLPSEPPPMPASRGASDVEAVFDYWREKLSPKAKLDAKRKTIIARALKSYTVAELCKAVDGTLCNPHRMGQNDRGQKYVGVHIVFGGADKIDPMIELAESGALPVAFMCEPEPRLEYDCDDDDPDPPGEPLPITDARIQALIAAATGGVHA